MKAVLITKQQACRFILAHQGLWPPHELHGKTGVLNYIRHVGCIQFDPLNIVGHNPELVLQSRVVDFEPAILRELLYADRKLLDGWDKVMSIYSVEDWPYFQRLRDSARQHFGHSARPATTILPQVRQAIEQQGPLSSLDLDYEQTVDWAWAPTRMARAALESMYSWGELVIHHKVHTRKVYDFAYRHIPQDILSTADPNPTEAQYQDWYVQRRIGGIGLLWSKSGDAWIGMHEIKSKERLAALQRLLKQKKILEIRIAEMASPFYIRSTEKPLLEEIVNDGEQLPRAAILAPLDNLLWDRRLIETLFDFHYRWEVYKPVQERRYGYYVLPVLYGDRFIARFEPGQDKKNGALIIKQWWWEPDVTPSYNMREALTLCFQRFLGFLGASTLRIEKKVVKQAGSDWLISMSSGGPE